MTDPDTATNVGTESGDARLRSLLGRYSGLRAEMVRLLSEIVETPASGLSGVAMKLRLAADHDDDIIEPADCISAKHALRKRMLAAALNDAEQLTAGPTTETSFAAKGIFAQICGVSAARVSQWISEGKIHGPAIVGEGRDAKINVSVAMEQLGRTASTILGGG